MDEPVARAEGGDMGVVLHMAGAEAAGEVIREVYLLNPLWFMNSQMRPIQV